MRQHIRKNEMEIPIQVAVRIFPNSSFSEQSSRPNDDKNGNPIPIQAAEKVGFNKWNNLLHEKILHDTDNDYMERGSCVEAISIPATANLGGYGVHSSSALPEQLLDNEKTTGIVQVGNHSFPVTHALPINVTQSQIFHQTVFPLINSLMEGFDASVVTYGQSGTGKSYTLFGPGFDSSYAEDEEGIIQRCVREIFACMARHSERTYAINIALVEICGEIIRDLLGIGSVHCDTIDDVFHWLQIGFKTRASDTDKSKIVFAHTLFTLTLEQQWVSKEGLIKHRLSTISFSDLCGTERFFMLNQIDQPTSLPKDMGLKALEDVVNSLTDPAFMYSINGNVPYNQTTLTTLLKDSFGGRAQTLVILCVSPLERDINETISNLQFVFKVQCVRNYVIINTFSDDNTPITADSIGGDVSRVADKFCLQFAASQWLKLVSNAEGLFSKLLSSNVIPEIDKEQIEEWLFLKQECEDCLSSNEAIRSQKQLGPIQETEEPEEHAEAMSEPETSCQQYSDNESDSESQQPDLVEKLETLMEELKLKTDALVKCKHEEFLVRHPKAVMESSENLCLLTSSQQEVLEKISNDEPEERKTSVGGRRRSIQPGATLSSAEIAMLNQVASREQPTPKMTDDFTDSSSDLQNPSRLRAVINSPIESLQKKLRKIDSDISAKQLQIKEIEQTMQIKQNIITELVRNNDTRATAKHRVNKKKAKLETEYEKTKKQLTKAMIQGKSAEAERLHALISNIEQRLHDLASMKRIAGESGQNVKKMHQSLQESKKIVEELQKKIKKEQKIRDQLELDLKTLKEKEITKALIKSDAIANKEAQGRNLKDVQERISHLEHVLREKSESLELYAAEAEGNDQKEGLRHEIRNLRNTRDHLLKTRCALDRKLKREKMLSQREERKLLECDEAIEAIDAAIEFKNELICGHKSIDTSERLQREKGEQMLMARLNKLSPEEMRTLLYKYFNKVIDLRDSSRKLEVQLIQLERERDAWEWRERVLSNAVRQARLEGERNAVLLQRQHEMKLTLMMRHLAEETSTSSTSFSDQQQPQHLYKRSTNGELALASHQQQFSPAASSPYSVSEFDFNFYKHTPMPVTNKILKSHKHNEMEICPLPDSLSKYKPLDKIKDKERENKLFANFQVLTRYDGQSLAVANGGAGEEIITLPSNGTEKKIEKESLTSPTAAIPQANIKRLMSAPPATKVIRQKNKIIIQDATRKN